MKRAGVDSQGGPASNGALVRCEPLTFDASASNWVNITAAASGDCNCSTVAAWPLFPGDVAQFGVIPKNAELDALTSCTFEAWVKLVANNFSSPINRWTHTGGIIIKNTGEPGYFDNSRGAQIYGATPMALGSWAHIAVTLDNAASTGTIYLNGAVDGSGLWNVHTGLSFDLYVGQFPGFWPVNGEINEARLYDRVLSADEVARNYQAGRARHQ
jgi:hypothetical protein